MDLFEENNDPLTLGVIGNYIGEDSLLTEKIQAALANGNWDLAVGNNGYKYEFFTNTSLTPTDQVLKKKKKKKKRANTPSTTWSSWQMKKSTKF